MTRYTPQWLQAGSYAAGVDRRLIGALWPSAAVSGCAVTFASAMTVNIAAGQVAVPTSNGTGSLLCSSDAVEQVTLAAAPGSGTNRIDLVVCQARGNDVDGGSNNDFLFAAVTGTPAASPAAPAVPANAVALARILVPGGSAAITPANITMVAAGPLGAGAPALPPPLAAGAAIQSYTDATGQVWVAKGGVNGGAWRLARDVLHSRAYRAAAWTFVAGIQFMPFDTITPGADPYGLYATGPGAFTVPIGGVWNVTSMFTCGSASGSWGVLFVYKNGSAFVVGGPFQASSTANLGLIVDQPIRLAAGDKITMYSNGGPTSYAGGVGDSQTFCSLNYLGTG